MSDLRSLLETHVGDGSLPGAVALVAHREDVEVAAVGSVDTAGTAPMARDSLFRIASVTKPVTAAATMMLVEDGLLALDVPVARWLPELGAPTVVRTPAAPLDDVVPADRPITVADLLTFRAGYGFPADFSLPAVAPLFGALKQGPPRPQEVAAPDAWMAALGRIPLLHQPGEAWLYNTCSDILGVLIARATGQPFQDVLAERVFEPLGMRDTAFAVPRGQLHRFTSYYRPAPDGGGPELVDTPDGEWSTLPAFPSGAGGLVSTVDDLYAFNRMLLAGGSYGGGRRLLSADSVRQMTTDHLTAPQRAAGSLFLEGQGWGFGGSVDVARLAPWNVPGRYGWIGGTGTAAHIVPATGTITLLLTQRELAGPASPEVMRQFWTYAAARP
ncbi:CubicO group peptidase (beta-lactamase class C family) [Streptomyces sp. CG 926]|uniref:serine hydrolase domain-containing protein n=1 Tax=Streptomyces sp. CG 926 TaxID=1882405 RepID=UPI000D6C4D8D|nr:serine hydrolase domain-containing protein [Streptomyces sp. CG 926]PWK64141.1 CubicO group peptidase (beta-lactamase class C family) [Streptomyces sp. CG 926]